MLRLDWNLLFTVINLLIFFFLLKKFLFKPVEQILEKRQQEVEAAFGEAADKVKEAEQMKNEYAANLSRIEEEKAQKLAAASRDASAAYERIVDEAREESERIIQHAKSDAEYERTRILKQTQEEITDMVLEATVKMVGEKVSPETDSALYDEFLTKAGEV